VKREPFDLSRSAIVGIAHHRVTDDQFPRAARDADAERRLMLIGSQRNSP
jgi:hypothetical protein